MKNYEKYFEGHEVPDKIKEIAKRVMIRFNIHGLCDGMYICNVIAESNGIGDGYGCFTGDEVKEPDKAAHILQSAYGCNINSDDIPELAGIISSGKLNIITAIAGLQKYIKKCKVERHKREGFAKSILINRISEAEELICDLLDERRNIEQGSRIWVEGDSAFLGIDTDYDCRICTGGTIEDASGKHTVLVTIDEIDGDRNVCVSMKRQFALKTEY